jgi:hypothetical protein
MQDVIITLANEQYSAEKKIEVKNPRLTDNTNKKKTRSRHNRHGVPSHPLNAFVHMESLLRFVENECQSSIVPLTFRVEKFRKSKRNFHFNEPLRSFCI